VPLQRDVQRVDRFQVRVIGRLVQQQHVRLLQHQPAKRQTRRFPARQRFGPLHRIVAAKQHLPRPRKLRRAVLSLRKDMPVRLKGPIPSVDETANRVGVSRRRAGELARYAESQVGTKSLAEGADISDKAARAFLEGLSNLAISEVKKNGVFVLKGIGSLVRVNRKARTARNPGTGERIMIPAKKVLKFRLAKAAKDAIVPPKKK
jgi:DNA-binding protein HU-beta